MICCQQIQRPVLVFLFIVKFEHIFHLFLLFLLLTLNRKIFAGKLSTSGTKITSMDSEKFVKDCFFKKIEIILFV